MKSQTSSAELSDLLAGLKPRLQEGRWVFATFDNRAELPLKEAVAMIREAEGVSLILPLSFALKNNLSATPVFSWITLEVHSALDSVGLTAAFSRVLAGERISCNVVAGHHHDHIFVPEEDGRNALEALRKLEKTGPLENI
ncbi:ACT domain-containing protein [Lewinella sp. W8]|uniref:ACT domain-containing protein n=1 Tax=Lewinella sp. W8 TaxID=2528208 RepID=UPI0010674CFD|nr:ACT domain-containing protein [Lewinella sp. W8]MTB50454.1 ACT domain-containing protein [Lewinella sp. W8]